MTYFFTKEQFLNTFKSDRAKKQFSNSYDAYAADVKAQLANSDIQSTFFAPNLFGDALGLGLHMEFGYLIQMLSTCNDQLPVDIMNVRNLLDKENYGLFNQGKFKNDLEVTFPADRIAEDDDYMGAGVLKGGRHRLAAILSVLHEIGIDTNSEDVQSTLVRVIPSTFDNEADVPTLQLLSNTSRSMGVAEKAYGKVSRLDIETGSPEELINAMSKATLTSLKSDLYRTLFSVCVREDASLELTPNTLADIGASFYTTIKKLGSKQQRATFAFTSNDLEKEVEAHLDLYTMVVANIPQVLEGYSGQNIARIARAIGKELAEKVIG